MHSIVDNQHVNEKKKSICNEKMEIIILGGKNWNEIAKLGRHVQKREIVIA